MARLADLQQYSNPLQWLYGPRHAQHFRREYVVDPTHVTEVDEDTGSKMLRDPDISFAFEFRKVLVAGTGFHVEPGRNPSRAMELRAEVEETLYSYIRNFDEGRQNLVYADMVSGRYAQVQGEIRAFQMPGDTQVRKWAVPRLMKDMAKEDFRNYIVNDAGDPVEIEKRGYSIRRNEYVKIDRPQDYIHHRVNNVEEFVGAGYGLQEALVYPWQAKAHLSQTMDSACDRFGEGWVKVTLPSSVKTDTDLSNSAHFRDVLERIAVLRRNGVLVLNDGELAELMEGAGRSFQMLVERFQLLQQQIVRVILGAVLPTGGGTMAAGSYKRAETEKTSTQAIVGASRARLERTLSEQLSDWCEFYNRRNYEALGIAGARHGALKIDEDDQLSQFESAEVLEKVLGAGIKTDADETYEALGMKRPDGVPDVIEGAMAASNEMRGLLAQPQVQ